ARLGSRHRLRSRRPASGRFRLPGGNLCPYRRSGRRNGQGTLPVLPSVWTDRGMLRRILWTAVSVVPTSHPCLLLSRRCGISHLLYGPCSILRSVNLFPKTVFSQTVFLCLQYRRSLTASRLHRFRFS